ncbi:hypothetical protein Q5P01_009204 [Channa striata]|uniref:Uncharacterized protein n=1 Tax=Channa striata TaxID=64152 RepID=A0AA88N251_CHASR|nr:hypothetical protein Q5P01_009204 [Channa striata]
MSYVIAAVCLHIGPNVSKELNDNLEPLETLRITGIPAPSKEMQKNALSCEVVFIQELLRVVGNVTVPEPFRASSEKLRSILTTVAPPAEDTPQKRRPHPCRMKETPMPFKQYRNFLMKLNTMRTTTSATTGRR